MTRADDSMRAAQARYDAMEPPEHYDVECPDCGGRGWTDDRDDEGDGVELECSTCDGRGLVPDADAEPGSTHD